MIDDIKKQGNTFETPRLIIGAGGAMTQLCRSLDSQRGGLRRVLQQGICVDDGDPKGLGQAVYPANSVVEDLIYTPNDDADLAAVAASEANRALKGLRLREFPPLTSVQALIVAFREEIFRLAESLGNEHFHQAARIVSVMGDPKNETFTAEGRYLNTNEPLIIRAQKVLFAAGGEERMTAELAPYNEKVIMSSFAGSNEGMLQMHDLLRDNPEGEIAFIGNGASTYGCISWLLKLADETGIQIKEGQIKVLHYKSGSRGMLNPMALMLAEKCDNGREKRVQHITIFGLGNRNTAPHLERADLIVQAIGYQAPEHPILHAEEGEPIARNTRGCYTTNTEGSLIKWGGWPVKDLKGLGLVCERNGDQTSNRDLKNYGTKQERLREWLSH